MFSFLGHILFLAILFKPFGCQSPKYFKLMWLPNILTLNEPDEDYS
jgi:hypothetical protein